jgi:hypothetical protein
MPFPHSLLLLLCSAPLHRCKLRDATLQDYVTSVSADAAGMAAFQLSEARPGAQPLADPAATIAAAGVANAMLVLKSS